MGAWGFVVFKVWFQNALQRRFIEDDYVVQALLASGADETLCVRVLPWRSRGQNFQHPHLTNSLMECGSVNTIAIVQQITRCTIPRERFSHLSCRPFGGGMRRHVEVNQVTPVMAYHQKYKQQAKAHRPYNQKICCYYLLNLVLQKRAPTLRRRLSLAPHILSYRRLRDLNSQLQQLSVNPRGTPQWIGFTHLAD